MYPLLRTLLFLLDAETSHRLTLTFLRIVNKIPGMAMLLRALYRPQSKALAVDIMGLHFPNPVGLAAGLDKNAECTRVMSNLGFGGVEIGTVTPRPQPGNETKRLFRLPQHRALINRMGFPSIGIDAFLNNLRRNNKSGVVGINIGKNKNTPNDKAIDDYLSAFRATYSSADYIAINISSPNTPNLRDLQSSDALDDLLKALKHEQIMLGKTLGIYVPIALKISPDLDQAELVAIADMVLKHKLDAIIATNTTIDRDGVEGELLATEIGGLSGRPLKEKSTQVVRILYNHLKGKIPIIGVGGIENANDAWDRLVAGADFLQIYTGFIFEGPAIIKRICRGLEKRISASGCKTLTEAVEVARTGVHLMR
ncbi:MAG: dihydroorotate dehydrogenase (quinone) [Acidiferrobacterales bacterium]